MLQFMKNKILLPILILGGLALALSFKYATGNDLDSVDTRKELIIKVVIDAINRKHFSPRPIDDSFSVRIFQKTMDNLDYEKIFFTQQDLAKLSKYKYKIDDEINNNNIEFFDTLSAIFRRRVDNAQSYYKEWLGKPYSFTINESVQLNGEKQQYASNDEDAKERWRLYLKYRVLAKYVDLKKDQDSSKDATLVKKTPTELEAAARASVLKNQDNYFKRLKKLKDDELFSRYVNNITTSEDPHTDYFPPVDKARFDEQMSGSFSGIGAQLREEEGKIKVAAIVTGSPSWKQGELKAGDEIIKVAQAAAEPVDIQGFEIDDVVKIIRGKKGTEVRLTVKKLDGSQKTIAIIRGEVLMEEVFAKSAVIETPGGPIGYLYLPEFYADFQKSGGRRSADDVAKEVTKLKDAGVTGIIMDLRGNGGGSLADVVDIAGLFIDLGPIVQVKSSNYEPQTQSDRYRGTLYDGPLAIMVNQGSASASEIMAAAMQDYKRAFIVGSNTFGKGTVQSFVSLDETIGLSERMALSEKGIATAENPIGSLKVTMQKFYRINGGSTQLRGVKPDIILPDLYKYIDVGEGRDKSALKWDEIRPAEYSAVPNALNIPALVALSKKRTESNPTFDLIDQNAKRLKQQEDENTFVLTEAAYRQKQEEANSLSKKMDALENKGAPLKLVNLKQDMARVQADSSSIAKNEDWLKALRKDIYIGETVNIISDINRMSPRKSNLGTGMK